MRREATIKCDEVGQYILKWMSPASDKAISSPRDQMLTLNYRFHTLEAKDFRHVSYETRFLTRTMATRVHFGSETDIKSVTVIPQLSCLHKPNPSDFDFMTREVMASGWLLPRSEGR